MPLPAFTRLSAGQRRDEYAARPGRPKRSAPMPPRLSPSNMHTPAATYKACFRR